MLLSCKVMWRVGRAVTSDISKDGKAAGPFITDIEPYFFGRPITYVDAGAHNGSVFRQLLTSGFYVREAHLVEPNPRTFDELRMTAGEIHNVNHVACHNIALSSSNGSVVMRDEDSMTHVVPGDSSTRAEPGTFEVATTTLDDLVERHGIGHINLLKVDVEGHELQVLEGASRTLADCAVDVIYIEAGIDPDSERHVHYRALEDVLLPFGYRILRFYEQRNEWLVDSPLLRRTNIAFASSIFAESHPFKLSRELARLRKKSDQLAEINGDLRKTNNEQLQTATQLRARVEELQVRVARLSEQVASIPVFDGDRELDDVADSAGRRAAARNAVDSPQKRWLDYQEKFVDYADELERRYLALVNSRTWRAMEPVRLVGRALRRLRGRPVPRNRLPKRPSPR